MGFRRCVEIVDHIYRTIKTKFLTYDKEKSVSPPFVAYFFYKICDDPNGLLWTFISFRPPAYYEDKHYTLLCWLHSSTNDRSNHVRRRLATSCIEEGSGKLHVYFVGFR